MSSSWFSAAVANYAVAVVLIVSPGSSAGGVVLTAAGRPEPAYQQPRDPRSDVPRPETQREVELKAATAAEPTQLASWFELAKLQEERGANADAEQTFKLTLTAVGPNKAVFTQSAGFFTRQGRFDQAVEALQAAADLTPTDPAGYQLVASYYQEKAFKDQSIAPADKARYIDAGIAATDRALALKADFIDALVFKNLLLRMKSQSEPDTARQQALIAEAEALRNQALELRKAGGVVPAAGAPDAPPPPGAPVRVGSMIKTPAKIQHVSPVYPQEAQDARVAGMVIIEVTINVEGSVESAKVLRSIPMLDNAALDAVKQWRFTPTILNGAPVPVIMTVTVNFTLQ